MGYKELMESLEKDAGDKRQAIWQEAEAEAEAIRAEAGKRIELLKRQYQDMRESATREQTGDIIREAEKKASELRASSEAGFLRRLYPVALSALRLLRGEGYAGAFKALSGELPHLTWQKVKVNPDDAALARELFPDSEVIPEEDITGGMEAVAEEGRIRVVNTLEKRLERAWPLMGPDVIRDAYREIQRRA